jgi:hypothetical protein
MPARPRPAEEDRSIGLEDRVALLDADQTVQRMRVADAAAPSG